MRDLVDHLTGAHDKLHQAFAHAYQKAVEASGDEALQPLLEHQPFQEEVVTALLDPLTSFDVQKAGGGLGRKTARACSCSQAVLQYPGKYPDCR